MNQTNTVDTKALMEEAKASKDKEAYKLLENTSSYRIGAGARIDSPNPSTFFIELLVKLSTENDEVNLPRLVKNLTYAKSAKKKRLLIDLSRRQ